MEHLSTLFYRLLMHIYPGGILFYFIVKLSTGVSSMNFEPLKMVDILFGTNFTTVSLRSLPSLRMGGYIWCTAQVHRNGVSHAPKTCIVQLLQNASFQNLYRSKIVRPYSMGRYFNIVRKIGDRIIRQKLWPKISIQILHSDRSGDSSRQWNSILGFLQGTHLTKCCCCQI